MRALLWRGRIRCATGVVCFKIGLAAFLLPYMFFFSPAMPLQGATFEIVHIAVSAVIGVYLLAAAVQGWFLGHASAPVRVGRLAGGLCMIAGGWITDGIGLLIAAALVVAQRLLLNADPRDRDLAKE